MLNLPRFYNPLCLKSVEKKLEFVPVMKHFRKSDAWSSLPAEGVVTGGLPPPSINAEQATQK